MTRRRRTTEIKLLASLVVAGLTLWNLINTRVSSPPLERSSTPACVWAQQQDVNTNKTTLEYYDSNNKGLQDRAEENAAFTFAGKSVLVLGGSTSRDLAADFMQMVLPTPELRSSVSQAWDRNATQGHEMLPGTKKKSSWEHLFKAETQDPLLKAGWTFQQHLGPTAGCKDCFSSYTNVDYVARWRGGAGEGGITYEFSWKPEIFTQADTIAFRDRYCGINKTSSYDVVHIGKGLHDSYFKKADKLTIPLIRERFIQLSELVSCFPETTLVVLRTPYYASKKEKEKEPIKRVVNVVTDLVNEGFFGKSRSIVVNGYQLTTTRGHPDPYDGHHYPSVTGRAYWRLVALIAQEFFRHDDDAKGIFSSLQEGKFANCSIGGRGESL